MSQVELQDIVGQDRAVGRLRQYMRGGRMPHAFLFAGPDGVGRRTTAIALAKVLLCSASHVQAGPQKPLAGPEKLPAGLEDVQAGPEPVACGQCEDCRMISAGSHPDFHLVYKELARYHDDARVRDRVMQGLGIDVIRKFLISPAGRAAARGRGKVFVVLEAELMSSAAQNALLKTLEEPPDGVKIILVCARPDALLPTTLSRCAMVRFGPLPKAFITEKLAAAGMDDRQAAFWAAFTDGAIGQAIDLSGKGMYDIKREFIDKLAKLPAGGDVELAQQFVKATDKLAAAAVAETKKTQGADLSKRLASRRAAGAMLALVSGAYRDALTLATGCDRPIANADQLPAVQALAERFDPGRLAEIIDSLSRFEKLLWRNVNPQLVWDNVVITCASGRGMAV